ncbi:MAG TPA: radical SAM protein [Candidatus Nanoarchaeia archaeon]|nr:radical SAM protein [Candidatus Nanoarchaeia archaeon]
MLKLYKEHPEFDEFTKFDTETGKLVAITEEEFKLFLPEDFKEKSAIEEPIQRIETKGVTIFTGETPETHTRFPRRIYFQITRYCNLECPTCFIKAGEDGAHVPTNAVMDVAEFMGQKGLIEARLTGGEPTLHPDFFDILHKFQEKNVYVSVATNGVMSQRTLDALCEESNLWVICSIDGNRETHNRYRSNTFDRIVRNLRYLKSRNPATRLRLTTVLTKENKGQMYELGELTRSLGAESITVIPLRPQVRDPRVIDDMVTAGEFRGVIEDLVRVKEELGIRVTTTLETDYKEKIYADPVFRKRSSCAAGREGTNLDYDAEKKEFVVYGCSYSPAVDLRADPKLRRPFLAGTFSIHDASRFLDIWRDDSAWTIFRDLSLKSDDCMGCEYFTKHQCVGSCPIQNLDYSSLDVGKDLLTQLREQIQHTSEWYCYKKIVG